MAPARKLTEIVPKTARRIWSIRAMKKYTNLR
jgi:hypothetical protein